MNLNERGIVQNSDLNRYPFRPVLGLKQPVLDLKRSELSKVEVAKPSGNFRSKSRFPGNLLDLPMQNPKALPLMWDPGLI